MALPGTGVVNRGLQILLGIAFNTSDAFAVIQSMSVDDNASNFAAADTALNTSRGAVTNMVAVNFSPTPTRSSQTITFTSTFPASGTGNFNGNTIKGIALHNLTGTSVTASTTSLAVALAVNFGLAKTSSFGVAITGTCSLTDNTP